MTILTGTSLAIRDDILPTAGPVIAFGVGDVAGLSGYTLCLTQKGQAGLLAAVEYVCGRTDAEVDAWRHALGLASVASAPFSGVTLLIEDASPDSCLTLVALAWRLAGKTLPDKWVAAAKLWEIGRVDPGDGATSWGTLHSALVHAEMGRGNNANDLHRPFTSGVIYVAALLAQDALTPLDPLALPVAITGASPELTALQGLARLRFDEERLSYRTIRAAAMTAQLHVPTPSGGRRGLVDAMFLTQIQLESALKTFMRRDPDSWTGRGYAFNALYRQELANSGNDITFSLDPDCGLWLEPLWAELEKREDAAWLAASVQRPRDQPRHGMRSFAVPRSDGLRASNQPWWDDSGRYTLVGAPRSAGEGLPGTRLDWNEVLDVVWTLFAPGYDLKVIDRNSPGQTVDLIIAAASDLRHELVIGGEKHIVDVTRQAGADDMIIWCPTFERALAAVADTGQARLQNLPDASRFDLFRLRHGVAVVAHNGVLLMATDNSGLFPAVELRKAATAVAATHKLAVDLAKRMAEARQLTVQAISESNPASRRDALRALYIIEVDARQNWPSTAWNADPQVARFAEACENRWSAVAQFTALIEEANALEAMITSASDAKTSSLIERVTLYGFPLALFSNILGVVFAPWGTADQDGHVPLMAFNIAFGALGWFIGLSVLLMIILALRRSWEAKQWKIDSKQGLPNAKP